MFKRFTSFLQDIYGRVQDDEVPALGAQLTYYLILSFFPFVIFLITLSAYTPLSQEDILADLISVMPTAVGPLVGDLFKEIIQERSGALLSIGMIAAIWTASSGMMAMIRALNKAYDVPERRAYWKVKVISIIYTLCLSLLICLAFVLLVFGHIIGQYTFGILEIPDSFELLWGPLKNILTLIIMCMIFSLLYYTAPNRNIRYYDALPGALFTTVGWVVISLSFSYYVNHFNSYTRTYGSLGGIIILLVWLYLSSILILLGGEINASLTCSREGKEKTEGKSFGFRWPFSRATKS
ncbi:MAG: YihY/virulence factor BrkB family protein [Paenibacillaceae bacterium]